jgi:periplasmic protein TonB
MNAFAVEDRTDLRRWVICGTLVVCMHAAIVAALIQRREPVEEGDFGDDIILLELRPEQVQADPTPSKPVEQHRATPTPDKPVESVEKNPDPPPQQQSEVMLQPEMPAPQTAPTVQAEVTPAPVTTAAQAARTRAAVTAWRSQIASILEHYKRYPQEARARREQGQTQLAFSIDRQGHVMSSHVVTSSGFASLDNETLALVHRAQPFPIPPPEVLGDEIKFTVPVRFNIR